MIDLADVAHITITKHEPGEAFHGVVQGLVMAIEVTATVLHPLASAKDVPGEVTLIGLGHGGRRVN